MHDDFEKQSILRLAIRSQLALAQHEIEITVPFVRRKSLLVFVGKLKLQTLAHEEAVHNRY